MHHGSQAVKFGHCRAYPNTPNNYNPNDGHEQEEIHLDHQTIEFISHHTPPEQLIEAYYMRLGKQTQQYWHKIVQQTTVEAVLPPLIPKFHDSTRWPTTLQRLHDELNKPEKGMFIIRGPNPPEPDGHLSHGVGVCRFQNSTDYSFLMIRDMLKQVPRLMHIVFNNLELEIHHVAAMVHELVDRLVDKSHHESGEHENHTDQKHNHKENHHDQKGHHDSQHGSKSKPTHDHRNKLVVVFKDVKMTCLLDHSPNGSLFWSSHVPFCTIKFKPGALVGPRLWAKMAIFGEQANETKAMKFASTLMQPNMEVLYEISPRGDHLRNKLLLRQPELKQTLIDLDLQVDQLYPATQTELLFQYTHPKDTGPPMIPWEDDHPETPPIEEVLTDEERRQREIAAEVFRLDGIWRDSHGGETNPQYLSHPIISPNHSSYKMKDSDKTPQSNIELHKVKSNLLDIGPVPSKVKSYNVPDFSTNKPFDF